MPEHFYNSWSPMKYCEIYVTFSSNVICLMEMYLKLLIVK